MKRTFVFMLCLPLLFFIAGCNNADELPSDTKTKVTVILDWVPNTNHTGLYVAKAKGFYAEEGLAVEIVQPAVGGSASLIAAGQGDFGVSYQEEVAYARDKGLPVVSLAAVIQHNTSGFASHADHNINSPKDWAGKRYGGWGSEVETHMISTLMEKYGADPTTVQEVNIGEADFFASIERDVDFTWIYYAWTGIEAELRGIPLNIIMPQEEEPALDFYTPVLITKEDAIVKNPHLVRSFMAATAKGYQLAIERPDEAAEILLAAVPELDPELVKASQKWLATQYQNDAPYWGYQRQEVWENYTNWLVEHQLLDSAINVENAFTNDFLISQ